MTYNRLGNHSIKVHCSYNFYMHLKVCKTCLETKSYLVLICVNLLYILHFTPLIMNEHSFSLFYSSNKINHKSIIIIINIVLTAVGSTLLLHIDISEINKIIHISKCMMKKGCFRGITINWSPGAVSSFDTPTPDDYIIYISNNNQFKNNINCF